MSVTIVCVGKLREKFFADAAQEYEKRLSRLMPVAVTELPDEREPDKPTDALCRAVMAREGERILRAIDPSAYVVAMCVDAPQPTSEALAEKLRGLFLRGQSRVTFVIGGSLGLSDAVLRRADERMGLSRLTLPHQLCRVVLLEQLYRSAKINAGERYHK